MVTAKEIEALEDEYENLKKQESEINGSISAVMKQLKEYGIDSIEDAEKYIDEMTEKKNSNLYKLEKLIKQIKKLL